MKPSADHCRTCRSHSDAMVRFWDGHWYCRDCVDAVCPELFDHAKAHPTLSESAPFTSADIWRTALRMEAILFLFFASLFSVGACQAGWGLLGVFYGTAGSLCLCLIQGGLQLPVFVWMARAALPSVAVSDGTVYVQRRWPKGRRMRVAFPLEELRWRTGKSRQDTFLRATVVPKVLVILLLHSPGRWGGAFQYRIACGWTDETRRIWSGFLTLAGRPKA